MAKPLTNNGNTCYFGVDLDLEIGFVNAGYLLVTSGYISNVGFRPSSLSLGAPLVNVEPNGQIYLDGGSTISAPAVVNRSYISLVNYRTDVPDTRINTATLDNFGFISLDGRSGLAATNGAISNYGEIDIGSQSFVAVVNETVNGGVTTQTLGDYDQYAGLTRSTGTFHCDVNLYGGMLTLAGGSLEALNFRGPATLTMIGGADLFASGAFSGTISGFAPGDAIDVSNVPYTPGQHIVFDSLYGSNQIWNLEDANHKALAHFVFTAAPTTAGLRFSDDGAGGTVLSYGSAAALGDNFNGGVKGGVLLLDSSQGKVSHWTPDSNGDTYTIVAGITPGSGWSVAGSGDFNGDGATDVLLRNQNGGVSAYGVWLLQNGVYSSFSPLGGFADNSGWSVLGTGDFNGDHVSDVLLSNDAGGVVQLYDWQISAGSVANLHPLNMGYSDASGWTTLGTGDFNGDGTADVLLQNTQSGQVGVWTASNGVANAYTPLGNATADWIFAGIGDFNGDGKSDILWRNGLSLNIWNVQSDLTVETSQVTQVKPFGWNSSPRISVADFNGDGTSDIYWSENGQGQFWYMHSDQPGAVLYRSLPFGLADQVVS